MFYVFKETEVGFGPFVYERAENPGMEADAARMKAFARVPQRKKLRQGGRYEKESDCSSGRIGRRILS